MSQPSAPASMAFRWPLNWQPHEWQQLVGKATRRTAGRPFQLAHQRQPHGLAASSNLARADRMELRPAERPGAHPAAPAGGVRRRLDAEAAEEVCAPRNIDDAGLFAPNVLPLLLGLVNKSLVSVR